MSEREVVTKPNAVSYFELNNQLNIPINGQIPLDKDKQAVRAYFLEHVNPNTVFFHNLDEKLNYLIEEGYIEADYLDAYSKAFIKRLFQHLYDQKFRFKSFMGAFKFYTSYAMKTRDNQRYLERYEDRIALMALYLAQGDEDLAWKIADEHIHQRLQMATPTFLNAGKKARGEMVSCFLLDVQDNMEAIGRSLNSALQLSKRGGGVGINLSNLREAGAPIKGIENAASGVVPVMKLFEDAFSYANQLGARQGAGVTYLSIFHPDIYAFLSTKKENADEKIRVKTLSLGVVIPDQFYHLLQSNQPMYLFSPYDVEREYQMPFSYVDLTAEYHKMVANDRIRKYRVNARELEQEISKLQQESGYPYIINSDTVNRQNPIAGRIVMSNLCSEIFQVQVPSQYNEDLSYQEVGCDVSCNLASTNILKMLESPNFEDSIATAIRALTQVSRMSHIQAVPSVALANDRYHSVGLGAMGLHTALAHYQIHYGSPEALEFTDLYFRCVRYYALKASNQMAKETQTSFYGFAESAYADGSYLKDRYIDPGEITIQSDKVQAIFKEIPIPTVEDWQTLNASIQKDGLYHAYLMAVAPTGSISYINETSASIHPIVHRIEHRQEGQVGAVFYPAAGLSNETFPYYTPAFEIDQRKIIDTYAAAQKHVDQGMSLTLFMASDLPQDLYEWKEGRTTKMTTRDLNLLRHHAFRKGIKSLYYVRTYTGDQERSSSNHCQSCVI